MPARVNLKCWIALLLAAPAVLLAPSYAAEIGAKTSKERLSDKAADEQRVDNCRVPVERRGTTPRPDCAAGSNQPPAPDSTAAKGAPAR